MGGHKGQHCRTLGGKHTDRLREEKVDTQSTIYGILGNCVLTFVFLVPQNIYYIVST